MDTASFRKSIACHPAGDGWAVSGAHHREASPHAARAQGMLPRLDGVLHAIVCRRADGQTGRRQRLGSDVHAGAVMDRIATPPGSIPEATTGARRTTPFSMGGAVGGQ